MAWFESARTQAEWPNPIPLVAFPPGGLYREAMFERIERERRCWYIAFSGSSLHNVLVAVEAGLGLSLLPRNATTGYHVRRYALFGTEPPMVVSVYGEQKYTKKTDPGHEEIQRQSGLSTICRDWVSVV